MLEMRWSLLVVLLSILVSSCQKEYYSGPEDQSVYFEYRYVNYAWGVSDRGWLIDKEGKIMGFEFPEDYRMPDSTGHISAGDLQYNLSQADTLLSSLEKKEFEKHIRLIGGAEEGNLGEPSPRGADMGSSVLSCYAYDPESDSYNYVLLARKGDWEQYNQSAEAEKLVKWLKGKGDLPFFN
jgi:hypothetical protein